MFVPLATTYEPLNAQRAAGVLRAHGILAWVASAASSGIGDGEPVPAGECLLMVKEGEAEQASRILEADALSGKSLQEGAHTIGKPLTLGKSLGWGIVQGAVWLPLISALLFCVLQVLAMLHWASGPMLGYLFSLSRALSGGIFSLILTGAAVGLLAGLGACLLSSYRHGRKTGLVFVAFIVLLVVLPELLHLLLR